MQIRLSSMKSLKPKDYLRWAQASGYGTSWSRVYAGRCASPENADAFDMLVVLGGPQSPRTTLTECPWFDSHAEQRLIAQAIAAGRIVVEEFVRLAAYR